MSILFFFENFIISSSDKSFVFAYSLFKYLIFNFGLERISRFEDITSDVKTLNKLKRLYKGNVDDMDLLVGMFAENEGGLRVPSGWVFGETQFAVFLQAFC